MNQEKIGKFIAECRKEKNLQGRTKFGGITETKRTGKQDEKEIGNITK